MTKISDSTVLSTITRELATHFKPEVIYLFGSRARGDSNINSDYDILIVLSQPCPKKYKLAQEAHLHLAKMGLVLPLDIHFASLEEFHELKQVVGTIPNAIDNDGKVLYAA